MTLNKNISSAVSGSIIIAFILGVLVGSIAAAWDIVSKKFFEVRLIEIIQVAVTIVIALVISYFIQSRIGFNMKKKEITHELIDAIQQKSQKLLEMASEYLLNTTSVPTLNYE